MKKYTQSIRFGLITGGCLIAYFLVLAMLGKHTNIFYSLFNIIITGFGIFECIRYSKTSNLGGFTYVNGFAAGLVTGVLATLIFTLFFTIYATELSPAFLEELSTTWFRYIASFEAIVFFSIAIMGFATTLILTLTFMQLFKTSNNLSKKGV